MEYKQYCKLIVLLVGHYETIIVDERNCKNEEEAKYIYKQILTRHQENVNGLCCVLIHM